VLQTYKPSTQAHLLSDINNHLLPSMGDVMLSHIATEVLQRFVASRKASPKTVTNIVGVMRSLWKVAKAWGYISHSPFEGLMMAKIRKPEPKMFTVDEARHIIEAAREPQKTFYWLAAETGMRAGELCGLCWEDVDDTARVVFVRQSAWKKHLNAPKTEAGRRRFCISTALAEQLHSRRQGASGLIFASKHGNPWRGGKVV
jgi:integrase